jgi:hypothetical protein
VGAVALEEWKSYNETNSMDRILKFTVYEIPNGRFAIE